MTTAGGNDSPGLPGFESGEDFFIDMGKRYVAAPQMDLPMFDFMRENGKLDWFSGLCDKYYSSCDKVSDMLKTKFVGSDSSVVEQPRAPGSAVVVGRSQQISVKSGVPAWRKSGSVKQADKRAGAKYQPPVSENRYDFPNSGVVDSYGDGYCYLNLVRGSDIAAVAADLGPSPTLARFFSMANRCYIPIDFWKYRGVVVDGGGIHVSGSVSANSFYSFALAVKHLFKKSSVLAELVDVGLDTAIPDYSGVTAVSVIGKFQRVKPGKIFLVEDVEDLQSALYRFAASDVLIVTSTVDCAGFEVDVYLAARDSKLSGVVPGAEIRPNREWKAHQHDQLYAAGYCYLRMFLPIYRDSLARKLGANPMWADVLRVPVRSLALPRHLAGLKVSVDKGVYHVGDVGDPLLQVVAALAAADATLAVAWPEPIAEEACVPVIVQRDARVGFLDTVVSGGCKELYVVEDCSDKRSAWVRFSRPGAKVVSVSLAKTMKYPYGVILRSKERERGKLGLPPSYVSWDYADWMDHSNRSEYGDGYCYLKVFRPEFRDDYALALGAFPTWRDICAMPVGSLLSVSELRALRVLKLGLNYHIGSHGLPFTDVIAEVKVEAYLMGENLAIDWPSDVPGPGFWGRFSLDSEVGASDLSSLLSEVVSNPLVAGDDLVIQSSAALLDPVGRARLRVLEAVGDAAITLHLAVSVASEGGTAEMYQNRRSSKASNTNLARLFCATPEMLSAVRFASGVNPAIGVVGAKAFESIVGAVMLAGGLEAVSRLLIRVGF